jgi:hypothetical protein
LRACLAASEDNLRDPGATQPIGINPNGWLVRLDRFVRLLIRSDKSLAKIGKR